MPTATHKNHLFAILIAIAAITHYQSFTWAQEQTFNAAGQAQAKMKQNHQRTGSIGNGYRPWSAWGYQNSAKTNARILNAYGQNCKELPAETAKEHLTKIRQDVVASKSELAKLGPDVAKEAELKQNVDALEKHLTECERLCDAMEKTISLNGVETASLCTHCTGLEAKLKAVEKEHHELLKKLGIELPIVPEDHTKHTDRIESDAKQKAD